MKRCLSALFPLLVASIVLIQPQAAMAARPALEVVDQQQVNDAGWYTLAGSGHLVAQTFSPGVNGNLTKVLLKLFKQVGLNETTLEPVAPSDLIVEIRATALATVSIDGGTGGTTTALAPTEQVLAAAVLPAGSVVDNGVLWYSVPFPAPALLVKGEVYAIVLSTNDPPPPWDVIPGGYCWSLYGDTVSNYDAYPRGQTLWKLAGAEVVWSISSPNKDMDFVTYMNIVKRLR